MTKFANICVICGRVDTKWAWGLQWQSTPQYASALSDPPTVDDCLPNCMKENSWRWCETWPSCCCWMDGRLMASHGSGQQWGLMLDPGLELDYDAANTQHCWVQQTALFWKIFSLIANKRDSLDCWASVFPPDWRFSLWLDAKRVANQLASRLGKNSNAGGDNCVLPFNEIYSTESNKAKRLWASLLLNRLAWMVASSELMGAFARKTKSSGSVSLGGWRRCLASLLTGFGKGFGEHIAAALLTTNQDALSCCC